MKGDWNLSTGSKEKEGFQQQIFKTMKALSGKQSEIYDLSFANAANFCLFVKYFLRLLLSFL